MQKRARWTISAVAAAGLFLTGAVTAFHDTTPARGHTKLAANSSVATTINLDNCPTLTERYHGGCVDQLQSELNTDDNAGLAVDGTFGATTRQAVITFQKQHNVSPADGIVGPETKAALDGTVPGVAAAPTPAPNVPGGTTAPDTPVPSLQYVALGDSYSSGEGLAPYQPGTDTPADTCHQSSQAYSQYVTPKPHWFAACSGQTAAGLTATVASNQEQPPNAGLTQSTGLVTFTSGGDDLPWIPVLLTCAKLERVILHSTLYEQPAACQQQLGAASGQVATMESNLITAYKTVLAKAPNAQVRVLNYPPVFPDRGGNTSGCRFARLNPLGQLVFAHDVEQQFVLLEQQANAAIADAVSQVQKSAPGGGRLQLVDTNAHFGGDTGHTVSCGDTGRPTPWVNSARISLGQLTALTRDAAQRNWNQFKTDLSDVITASFHPTREGQHQMYLALSAELPSGWR